MTKALLFDIGEVIAYTNFSSIYAGVAQRLGLSEEKVQRYFKEHVAQMLVGAHTPAQVLTELNLPQPYTPEEFLAIWKEEIGNVRHIDENMVALLRALRERYTIVAASNASEERYQADLDIGLYDLFDHVVLSFKEGVKKPDSRFYEIALERAQVLPEEALFIDDQQKMVEAAESVGIPSIQFVGYEHLLSELKQRGITLE